MTSKDASSQPALCRFCHEDCNPEDLISPCACSGSLHSVHQACLLRWIARSTVPAQCEVCRSSWPTNLVDRAADLHRINCTASNIVSHFYQHHAAQQTRVESERSDVLSRVRTRIALRRMHQLEDQLAHERKVRLERRRRADIAVQVAMNLMDTAMMGGGCTVEALLGCGQELRALIAEFDPGTDDAIQGDLHDWAITVERTAEQGMLTRNSCS
eukprot:TRINITY_DN14659_c0_g1_i3.p1 TRINITY_DN14659_c0_g1~~TRINITY_DN14659_c0_g1_i3.p1  ORF type:complete len:214 (-),score=36.23 TRINITY_DN14659_c0_g1_i3:363-1004(-)